MGKKVEAQDFSKRGVKSKKSSTQVKRKKIKESNLIRELALGE